MVRSLRLSRWRQTASFLSNASIFCRRPSRALGKGFSGLARQGSFSVADRFFSMPAAPVRQPHAKGALAESGGIPGTLMQFQALYGPCSEKNVF